LFWREKESNRYRILLASGVLAEKAFERCQRWLNLFKINASLGHKLLGSQNKTLQKRFVGLLLLEDLSVPQNCTPCFY